jgi:putative membrane protein
MKNLFNYCAALSFFIALCSCNSGTTDSSAEAKDSNAAKMDSTGTSKMDSTGATARTAATIPASVSKDDAKFVVDVADAGMTEVQLGQLAQQKGVAKDVKEYGAMMEKDHTAAGDKLKAQAASKNITLPSTVSNDMQKIIDDLQKKTGKDFDKAYINQMIDDHKKVISKFEDEIKNGSDPDIKAFATSTLPTLRKHLVEAEKCSKMMKKM